MALRFRFRLEPLLTIRRTKRDALRGELGQRTRAANRIRERIEEIHRAIVQGVEDSRNMLTVGSIDLSAVRVFRHQSVRWQGELLRTEQSLVEAQAEIEQARLRLLASSKDLEVIERLKEKARARHRRSIAHEEQLELDEVGMQMHLRLRGLNRA